VYAALAQEGDLTELSAPLLAQVADESLDEYWRMGGALKPTLQSIAALMASPRIIYAEELTELRSKIDLLVECLPLAELLERSAVAGCVSLLDFLNKPCPLGKMRGFKGFKGRLALGHQIDTELVYREIKLGKLLGCMRSGY
jgi:hypothetical protein